MSASDDKKGGGAQSAVTGAGGRQKPPVTIDLTAEADEAAATADTESAPTEVTPEPGARGKAAAEESGASKAPSTADDGSPVAGAVPMAGQPRERSADGSSGRGLGSLIVAAVIGGVIATALGIVYHASGIVPTRSETIAQEALDKINSLTASVSGLDGRIAALESQTAEPAGADITALSNQIAKLESQVSENSDVLARLSDASTGAATAPALEAIETRLSKLETMVGTGQDAALATLRDRVGAIEASVTDLGDRVTALAARPDQGAETERAARAVAIILIQQAAERGGPFVADLAMLKTLGSGGADLAALEPLAAKDTSSLAALQRDFASVAHSILDATAGSDPDAGLFDQLAALGGDLVTVRPIEPIDGGSAAAIVSRMQAAVDQGDLAGALSERDGLPEAGQAASSAWAAEASDRVAIDTLVQKLALSLTAAGN
ncbi:MAG: hypothetical protein GY798_06650 [Hyphomicrobiales bacterium]|nr:hypothetical protein [Hyphomicrobiales bacterium]